MAALCLPSIVEPVIVQAQDSNGVKTTSRQRPRSCPERSLTASTEDGDVLSALTGRLRGGQLSVLRQAFRAFDVKGRYTVTKEGLYRILCNLMSLSRKQFNQLLKRLHLEYKETITFDEFCSVLPVSTAQSRPRTTYLPLRGAEPVLGQMMDKCRKLDSYKCGKLNVDQLRTVLKECGVPITPMQVRELCADLGYAEGQLVKYTDVLAHFTARGTTGLLHSKLTNKGQRFHGKEIKRACTSMGDAQTRLVTLLNSQFLKLLAAFKAQDRRGRGYVSKETFQTVLESHVTSPDIEGVVDSLSEGSQWVPYPKFLAMFEHAQSLPTDPPTLTVEHSQQLVKKIRELVNSHSKDLMEAFLNLDTGNTGRLTLHMTQELLERFGVMCSVAQFEGVWSKLVRNKDTSTVHFQEFLRQFTRRPISGEGRHLSEDHYFMLSKNLHRDEDMVLESVLSRLAMYGGWLLPQLSQLDTLNTGQLPIQTFMDCVSGVLSPSELAMLRDKLPPMVPYIRLLTKPKHNPYRHGSNMSNVLAHNHKPGLCDTNPPDVLTARPPYGISAVKVHLQRQLARHWRLMRRLFRNVDKQRTGRVTICQLWSVLADCGVELSSEHKFHILEFLDPQLQGTVAYGHFISAVFEQ